MANFYVLFFCLAAGWLLRLGKRVPDDGHLALNALVVHVCLPALTLHTLHGFTFDRTQVWPALMPWVLFVLGAALFAVAGHRLGLSRQSIGALTLVGGLGNTSFVGLPVIEALYGEAGMALGLLIDQLGSYLVLSTLGVLAAAFYANGARTSWRQLARRVASFPPFVALILALVVRETPFPTALDSVLARLGAMLAPLALVSVGLQLRLSNLSTCHRALSLGLAYKLVACPALVIGLLSLIGAPYTGASAVSVIEAAVPPMIGAAVVATQYKLDIPLVTTMVGLGIPVGLLTTAAWHWLFASIT